MKISSTDYTTHSSMTSASNQNHLLIIEDDQGRKEFNLDRPVYAIGRDPRSDIRLVSHFVSRRHATLVRLPQDDSFDGQSYYYRVVDGDSRGKLSANGLMINGRKVMAHDLKNEDEIIFGPQVRAIYYLLDRDSHPSGIADNTEFDVTLISPGMTDDPED